MKRAPQSSLLGAQMHLGAQEGSKMGGGGDQSSGRKSIFLKGAELSG